MPCTAPSRNNLGVMGPCGYETYAANLCKPHWQMANGLVVPTGGVDQFTNLLLHCEGADASTVFTDSSRLAKVATVVGNTKIVTAQSKFGGSSAFFDGTGDYLDFPDSPDFEVGSGDFSIDLWVRFAALAATQWIFGKATGVSPYAILTAPVDSLRFFASGDGASWDASSGMQTGVVLVTNQWYHVAVSRQGANFYFFLDGALKDTRPVGGAGVLVDNASPLRIGADGGGAANFNGWLDEIRFTKGIARWTSSFAVPTGPYT